MEGQTNEKTLNYTENELIESIIIYISHCYPLTSSLLQSFIERGTRQFRCKLTASLNNLMKYLLQELVYGPSHSNVQVSKGPVQSHKDIHFLRVINKQQFSFAKAHQSLNIQQIIPFERIKELEWYHPKKYLLLGCQIPIKKQVLKELSIDGQLWVEATPLSSLFLILRLSIQKIFQLIGEDTELDIHLMRARLAFLHNKIIQNPVKQLCDIALGSYRIGLKIMHKNKTERQKYISVMLEYSYTLLFYYKYSASMRAIQMCLKGAELQIQYTGILGRRTKYQSFDTAQLIMNLKKYNKPEQVQIKQVQKEQTNEENQDQQQYYEEEKIDVPNPTDLIFQQIQSGKQTQEVKAPIKYDEESILLDVPKFLQQSQTGSISQEKSLVVLAWIHHSWMTVPRDQLLYQQISTSINTILLQPKLQYSVRFNLLLLRSLNQFPRVKNVERALEQFQALQDEYKDEFQKNDNIFPTPYEPFLSFIRVRADKLMEVGLVMSAVELFEKAGMFQECVDGLIKRDYKQKAFAMAERLVSQKGETPRLLCMMGDTKKQGIQFYERAWTLSNQRYPRAQKSLGWTYFAMKEYKKAAEAFQKSLLVSYYQPSTWFTLGCAYMKIQEYQKALRAFSESISVDDSQGEAWGNMASCYISQKKMKQAYSTLEQAVKHSSGSWKIWSNLLAVSLKVKQFYKYFECIQNLVNLSHAEVISDEAFSKIVTIFKYKLETSLRKMAVYHCQKRIKKLYQTIEPKIGQLPIFWRHLTNFYVFMIQYYNDLNEHYKKGRDQNDIVPGFQNEQLAEANYQTSIMVTKKAIVEAKQTELNMTMAIGWQQNKMIGGKVQVVLEEYIDIYKQYDDGKDKNQFQLFIKGLKHKLASCLKE